MIGNGLLAVIFGLIAVMGLENIFFAILVKKYLKNSADVHNAIVKSFDEDRIKLVTEFTDAIQKEFDTIQKTVKIANDANERIVIPKEARRCYAVVMHKGLETRLMVQPANTIEEMTEVAKRSLGSGWEVMSSAHADVIPVKVAGEVKEDHVEFSAPLDNFTYTLEYSRDKFTQTEAERRVVDNIITRVRKNYDRGTT